MKKNDADIFESTTICLQSPPETENVLFVGIITVDL
jgi:hypothetical protein